MKVSVKEVFESDLWIIIKVISGLSNNVRIDAKRRYPIADQSSFFSEWVKMDYASKLSRANYGKNISEFNCFES